ncbi:MAG: hypothetical protein ACYTG2_13535, partial [Planctomycetota bacterium]
ETLAYKETIAEEAQGELDALIAAGIDPDGERPPDAEVAPEDDGGLEGGPGRGLTSFMAGAEEQQFPLELVVAKKGVTNAILPSFTPPDQFLIWDFAFLAGEGPEEFRGIGPAAFVPFGVPMQLSRSGVTFTLDTDADGTPDVEFTPNSTPQLVELPSGEPDRVYPLMVSVPSDREPMFGMDVNYSLQPESARLRFNIAGWMEAKVLGETWKVYDSNLTGTFGDQVDAWHDGMTRHSDEVPHVYF